MNPQPNPGADRQAFEEIYQRHSGEAWAAAYSRCLDAELATDIMQDTFLRYWSRLEAGEEILNPRGWLIRVAHNLAEDHSRSAFRRFGTQPPEVMNGVRGADVSPLDKMAKDEFFESIRSILAELHPTDRELLTLKYALDYDSARIAEILGINVSALHMRLSRARQRLADKLTVHGVPPKP